MHDDAARKGVTPAEPRAVGGTREGLMPRLLRTVGRDAVGPRPVAPVTDGRVAAGAGAGDRADEKDAARLGARVRLLHRALTAAEERALATGETAAGLFSMAALLDRLMAEQNAAWRSLAPALGPAATPPGAAARRAAPTARRLPVRAAQERPAAAAA
jgi:hypothetical protein